MNNEIRAGRFTSSQIYHLMSNGRGKYGFGAPALRYIKEKQIERRMQRCLGVEFYSKATAWGKLMELITFAKLGTSYVHMGDESKLHPDDYLGQYWSGSRDMVVPSEKRVAEIKCYYPKNFALYTDTLLSKDLERIKKEFPAEYWQIVSSALIEGYTIGEAITYMPFDSEMGVIRDFVNDMEGPSIWEYKFVSDELDNKKLPVLPDNGYYKDLNQFVFDIPKKDIDLITERVECAIKLLEDE